MEDGSQEFHAPSPPPRPSSVYAMRAHESLFPAPSRGLAGWLATCLLVNMLACLLALLSWPRCGACVAGSSPSYSCAGMAPAWGIGQ